MLESLKKDVCEIAKRAQKDGLCKHKSGNFSARDEEKETNSKNIKKVDQFLLYMSVKVMTWHWSWFTHQSARISAEYPAKPYYYFVLFRFTDKVI